MIRIPPRNYDDIITLPRPESRRTRLPAMSRAAQFAPFAALTGFDDEIDETARRTEQCIDPANADFPDPDEPPYEFSDSSALPHCRQFC